MKYPKQKDQMDLIGALCTYSRELVVQYFKNGTRKWLRSTPFKKQTGKIVGFGCTYNGKYIPENKGYFDADDSDYARFVPSKRINHIKVRIKGEGKSLKIHPMNCKIVEVK